MKEINNDIKTGKFKPVYLLYGEERFLVKAYEHALTEKIVDDTTKTMNMDVFQGKDDLFQIVNTAKTLPFMSEKRIVIIRDSGLFYTGRKDDTEKIALYLENPPTESVVIFVEEKVDKRNKAYKKLVIQGLAVEFKTPTEKELISWVTKLFKERGKVISQSNIVLLLTIVGQDMGMVKGEFEKLCSFIGERDEITAEDINSLCTKSFETKIFDMIGAVGGKNASVALEIFNNLMLMKESPVMVISMLARQFRQILLCKSLHEQGVNSGEICEKTGFKSFIISKYLKQGASFSKEKLAIALEDCLLADVNIKTGKMEGNLAVEMLILKYCI